MPQENTRNPQQSAASDPKKTETTSTNTPPLRSVPAPATGASQAARSGGKKNRQRGRHRVGGTAVSGAKSTQPKAVPTTGPAAGEPPAENYNRETRRRMQRQGTGPYAQEERMQTLQEQRQKKIDRRKQRLEEQRAELRKSLPGGKITLGRRNTYFLIAVAALVVLLIVLVVLLRFVFHAF